MSSRLRCAKILKNPTFRNGLVNNQLNLSDLGVGRRTVCPARLPPAVPCIRALGDDLASSSLMSIFAFSAPSQAASENNSGSTQRDGAAPTGNLLRTLTGPEFSIAFGASILLAVLTNRLATPQLIDSQARTDILGIIASGGLVTNGVYLLVRSE